jgi:polysaccharide deacetylase 2 family uncharacterized protein YibQ
MNAPRLHSHATYDIILIAQQQAARMARLALIADELGQNEYREQVAITSLLLFLLSAVTNVDIVIGLS